MAAGKGGRLLGTLASLLAVVLPGVAAGASTSSTGRAQDGLHVQRRLFSYTLTSDALPGVANVQVLLPTSYAAHPHKRYPVLYLLVGTSSKAVQWLTTGDVVEATAAKTLIVVMPDITIDGDGGGWCTNWVNDGRYGSPEWTIFHIDQLIPWVDQNFRTIANRGGRAIAGLSQGGFCSMRYAARYPDLFGTVSAYSGAVDTTSSPVIENGVKAIINVTETILDKVPATSMFGNPATYQLNWEDHDPSALAVNLRDTNIYMYNGNGQAGPFNAPGTGPTPLETDINADNTAMHNVLDGLGVKNHWDDYGPGTHTWPYWARDLKENLPELMRDFSHPDNDPKSFTFKTATPSYAIYGWKVKIRRPAPEFSTLEHATAESFSLSGSGSATVTTPDAYQAGASYRVVIRGSGVHTAETLTAGTAGALRIPVPLGPGNPHEEFSKAAGSAPAKVYTTRVEIRART